MGDRDPRGAARLSGDVDTRRARVGRPAAGPAAVPPGPEAAAGSGEAAGHRPTASGRGRAVIAVLNLLPESACAARPARVVCR